MRLIVSERDSSIEVRGGQGTTRAISLQPLRRQTECAAEENGVSRDANE
jgi:hypothetical protein